MIRCLPFLLLPLVALALQVRAGEPVSLQWDRLSDPRVVAVAVWYGVESRQYTNRTEQPLSTNAMVVNLVSGVTYYFALTAIASNGIESGFSNEAVYTVRPSPPVLQLNEVTLEWGDKFDIYSTTNLGASWELTFAAWPFNYLTIPHTNSAQYFFITPAGQTNRLQTTIKLSP